MNETITILLDALKQIALARSSSSVPPLGETLMPKAISI